MFTTLALSPWYRTLYLWCIIKFCHSDGIINKGWQKMAIVAGDMTDITNAE